MNMVKLQSDIAAFIKTKRQMLPNKTGYGFSRGEDGIITIHKKDALAASVIEDMDDKATAKAVLEYNRFNMKGDLEGKRKLLKQIGDFIESTLQKRNKLPAPLNELADGVSFCLNNLNIRHNNKEGKHKKDCRKAREVVPGVEGTFHCRAHRDGLRVLSILTRSE